MPYYSNGTMNIHEFMIILGLKWLTRTDTIWHLVLALFGSLFPPSFFLVRLRWDATFGLLNLAPRLLATALLPKLVPGPRRVPGQRHWSLFRVHFFRYWACPSLRSFSQLLFLWARPHQRPHLLLFWRASLSIAMLCYFRPKQCKKQKKFRKINMILKWGRACALCKNKKVWESHRKSIKLSKPTNLGFHLQNGTRIIIHLRYLYVSILSIYIYIYIILHLLPICTPVLLIILASIGYYCILLWWLASYPLMLLGNNMPHAACLNIDDFVTSIRDPCPLLCLLRSQAHPFPHRLLWPESAELIVHLLALKSC